MKWRWPWASERKMTTLELFREIYGGRPSSSGKSVTWDTAIGVSAVFACTRVIANGISQVPLKLFREVGRSRVPAVDHPLYRVLHRRPNAWQTSFGFRQTIGLHLVLTGNAYVAIERAPGSGRVLNLIPLDPTTVAVKRSREWEVTYEVSDLYGANRTLSADMVWHIKGPSWCTYLGLDAVSLARDAIGLTMATEESQAAFHKNGAKPSGTYSIDSVLNPTQYAQVVEYLKKSSQANAGTPLILDRGAKWLQTAMTGVDAQHIETRKFQVEEIARAMGVMPIMIGASDKTATYASAEQMFIAHVVHTLSPWYECIEQSIDTTLLTERDERDGIYAKFVEEGLMRGAALDTATMLDKYVNGGIMKTNEARAKLDLDADNDPASDKLRVPANIVGKQPVTTAKE